MNRHGRARRRRLGQHFLVDPDVARRTLALADLAPGATVLEIGPGRGALTEVLLSAGLRVVAVELDAELAAELEARRLAGLTVVQGDFLRLDLGSLPAQPMPVVANLPYSSGTAILARLLEAAPRFPRIVVMLQREVAERLCALPGSRAYGALTVLTALRAVARLGFVVPPEAFRPRPEVESATVRLDVSPAPRAGVVDPVAFRRVVHFAFAQRRKSLRNALGAGLGAQAAADAALARAAIDPRRRAETLSLEEFATLTVAVAEGSATAPGPD
jgi:16S rRNA (adenine1518-N6/adenine1519-N6)-dimethyltransferase